ncbi:MAG: bifunctional precorrin-2 dehydrogenase/sirohydrochlorin ferrochelatase [Planctomycetota bacterium]|nr:bifunctional precorrin-2 dehydrogenase/sirohydrochlorin ferrochelatase [Planctomycetota bacterium]
MKTYPIMLNVRGRLAVVVGGGSVGLRKVRSLLDAGAKVRLIAPDIAQNADLAGVEVIRRPYRRELLADAMVVFACTADRAANAKIATDARAAGALINAADQPDDCDFYLPAVVRDEDVVVAIGTGGAAPHLASVLKQQFAESLPPRIGEFAALLGVLRQELKLKLPKPRRSEILMRLADEETYRTFCAAGPEAVRKKLEESLKHQ